MTHGKRRNVNRSESRRKDPLIGPGGKVDPAALFRASAAPVPTSNGPLPAATPVADDAAADGMYDDIAEMDAGDDDGDLVDAAPPRAQTVRFTLTRDLDKRLDKYLVDRITFLSRNKLQELIDAGRVSVNGRAGKASTKLRLGDTVEAVIDAPEAEDYPPQDIALDVLYEDEHMVVLNKSADIIVHPARTHTRGTLINALAYHFRHRSATGGGLSTVGGEFARPGVVHRLDRQTSGVIVFAKSDTAHWKLAEQFEKRTTDKRYVAFVHGKVEPLVDVIDVPIGPHPSREKGLREKQVVRHDHLGRSAVTIYRVLARARLDGAPPGSRLAGSAPTGPVARGWGSPPRSTEPVPLATAPSVGRDSPWVSVVEVELKTGRTHQIRVHMQHRLHPLLADDMYGGRALGPPLPVSIGRVALHASMLKIRHPVTGKVMEFVAPLPPDLGTLLRTCSALPSFDPIARPPGAVLSVDEMLGNAVRR